MVLTPRLYYLVGEQRIYLDVIYVVFILHLIPFLLMNVFLYKQYNHLKNFVRQDYVSLFLASFFGGAIGTIAIVQALFLIDFDKLSVVVLLQKLQPIFAILLARILLKEKLSKQFGIWATVAIFSSYFLTFGFNLPNFESESKIIYAALFAILAAFSFGSSTVFSKKVLLNHNFLTATFYRYFFTTVIMLVLVLVFGKYTEFHHTTPLNWVYFVVIGLTTGSGAIFIYYYGLRRVKAIVATIGELLFPASAILFDYLINDSVMSWVQLLSAAIMVFAIIKMNR